ncbi:hypothetical protein BG006_005393 [Podila minutissima]|uniref:Uncharacterized protein n=1 Tax=Podila minutissima TaxID=64525 RepID=A0A9P5SPI8_9FUNG|nr:hypothetical protein BG006_005393 [Podila minutissima]
MAHRTRLETLFEGDDTPVVHYNSNYKPRSLPSRPTNAKQFPSLANHYHTVHGHYNYPITTILENPLPASTKYLDLPQQQLQQYHARGTTSPTTLGETTTPHQQKFSLAHFWNRHLFTAPPPPQQQILSASPTSSPPTPELYRLTSAPPGVAPNNASSKIPTHQQQPPRHPQRSASSSSSLSYTLSPSSSSSSSSSSPSSSSSNSSSSESRLGSASSTCVSDSSSTPSPTSTTSSTSSLSNLVLGTISKRSSRTGLSLPFTSSAKSPSLASAPVPLTTSTSTSTSTSTTGSSPSTASSGLKTVPLSRSQSHSAVMVKRNSQSSVSSSVCPQHQQHQQGVMHGGRRGREGQQHEAGESTETAPQDEQDLQQPHILSIKKRVASGQAQLDHYRSMISQLEQQSSVFVQQQQELKERRDHVARAVESLENIGASGFFGTGQTILGCEIGQTQIFTE